VRHLRPRADSPAATETLAQALAELDARLFVGRASEIELFRTWLLAESPAPGLLHIWGPGGSGKTALLRAFERIATAEGRVVVKVDGRDIRPDAQDLASALGGRTLASAVKRLNAQDTVILVDTFELLVDLTRVLLRELIPHLGTRVRVVLAGRHPLGLAWEPWRPLIRDVQLGRLAEPDVRAYLERRGVRDPRLVDQVLAAARGLPLALSLVTDLLLQRGVRDLSGAPEWHLLVRSLVDHLLADVRGPVDRELLEAGAVVRQFDESLLAEVAGRTDISEAFAELCHLSVVQPGRHGLLLHDDIRHILAQDLRWRQPEHFATLRLRALTAYRRRMRGSTAVEREWLLGERLALWENAFVQAMLFTEAEIGRVWLDWGQPEDHTELERVWTSWLDTSLAQQMHLHHDAAIDLATLRGTLALPATRIRVARDADNRIVGFSTAVPICHDTMALVGGHPGLAKTVQAYVRRLEPGALPQTPAETDTYFFFNLANTESEPVATQQALIRDVFGLFARGGKYLVATPIPPFKTLFETLGFERLPEAQGWFWSDEQPEDGYLLDLTRLGVEPWIESIVAGRRPPQLPNADEIARSLHDDILPNWDEDARVAESPLASALAPTNGSVADRAAVVRAVVVGALGRLRSDAGPERTLALRALEGAYLGQRSSHERVAEDLGVSRSTFYRLLQRATRDLASAIGRAPTKRETR
jgi:hypothetical protein